DVVVAKEQRDERNAPAREHEAIDDEVKTEGEQKDRFAEKGEPRLHERLVCMGVEPGADERHRRRYRLARVGHARSISHADMGCRSCARQRGLSSRDSAHCQVVRALTLTRRTPPVSPSGSGALHWARGLRPPDRTMSRCTKAVLYTRMKSTTTEGQPV